MTQSKLTYKKKFYFLIIAFIVLLLAIYKKNIKEWIRAKNEITMIDKNLAKVDGSYNQIFYLNNEIKVLDQLIGGQSKKPHLVQQQILDFITSSDYKVNIQGVDDTHFIKDEEFNIYTNKIVIEGDFRSLLQLLNHIEQKFQLSKVASINFLTKKNYSNNTKKLFLQLILQNYEKSN